MNKNKTKQKFSYKAPGAHSVLLVGDFTGWMKGPVPLRKQSDGVWQATAWLLPGTHHYRFVVDGEWTDDPECNLQVQNPFGAQDGEINTIADEAQLPFRHWLGL